MGRSSLEWLCFIIAVAQRTFHSIFNTYDFRAESTCGILILGWRRSANRTRLQVNSLLTGNFPILGSKKPFSLQEATALQ
jgi:hypothetical protein